MPSSCYVVFDTESSVCKLRRRRLLVSLAWTGPCGTKKKKNRRAWSHEVLRVEEEQQKNRGVIIDGGYGLVRLPHDVALDDRSVRIHGITPEHTWTQGTELPDVLLAFFRCIERHSPDALVGHDVVGDMSLLVSELLHAGCSTVWLPSAVCRLVCTRILATPQCAIPLPRHLRHLQRRLATYHPPRARLFKWPSLQESYRLLVGDDDDTHHASHDARGDVERCRAIFLRLLPPSSSVVDAAA